MSIIGESFEGYVQNQIELRQTLQGKKTRTNSDLNILSNQNAWIKLASSVEIILPKSKEDLEKLKKADVSEEEYAQYSENWGDGKLKAIGLTNTNNFLGTELAKKSVLFNTIAEVNPTSPNDDKKGSYKQRSGVLNQNAEVWNDNFSYGLGGTTFGIVPPPGIIDASIQCKNRGSIREATVNIKAQNKFQFELIELLYLRLGYSMMLEWGWDKYIDNTTKEIKTSGNTIIEDNWFTWREKSFLDVLDSIELKRLEYSGNYDGFLGKVVNFDWTFNPDGTYDIMLKLITVGDVIESLTVNLPQETQTLADVQETIDNSSATVAKIGIDSPLVSGATTSTLAYKLFEDITLKTNRWEGKERGNYFGFYDSIKVDKDKDDFKTIVTSVLESDVNTDRFNYFLTLGELLEKVKAMCIPSVNQEKILDINVNEESNICSIYPYQISLDPKVALVKPGFQSEFQFANNIEYETGQTGIISYWTWMGRLKEFATFESEGAIYGKTMNIYLNYDFITATLQDVTNEGEIKLFKFLQKICDGINSAMGGLMKLEPVLNKDRIINIIDQNPIIGIQNSSNSEFKGLFNPNQVNFELFGYNPSGSAQTSNFVRDFKFNTTIGPNIASMISIGATAEGLSTHNYDGTGFANWNKGLRDRFQIKYSDPDAKDIKNADEEALSNPAFPLTAKEITSIFKTFVAAEVDEYFGIFPRFTSFGRTYKNFGLEAKSKRDVENCPVTGKSYGNVTWEEYSNKVRNWKQNQPVPSVEPEKFAGQYINFLIQCFGGKIEGRPNNKFAYYYLLNSDFIIQGKQLFKSYAKTLNNRVYEITGQPSNSAGFIPVGLDINHDGMSGVKIYNGIAIRQEFLPPAYPSALSFVISQVNHKISENDWTTNLTTISTANTKRSDPQKSNLFSNIVKTISSELIEDVIYAGNEPRVTLTSGFDVENRYSRTGLIYVPGVTTKNQIVLHHTAGFQSAERDIASWRNKRFPLATHYIIDRQGKPEHVFADRFWSNHLGANLKNNTQLNKKSYSIELTSIGYLQKLTNGKYRDYNGNARSSRDYGGVSEPYMFDNNNNIVKMTDGYRGKNYFQSYNVIQLQVLKTILDKWNTIDSKVDKDNFLDVFPPSRTLSPAATSGSPGIYTHNSYRTNKIDVFPQKELLELLYSGKAPTSILTVS